MTQNISQNQTAQLPGITELPLSNVDIAFFRNGEKAIQQILQSKVKGSWSPEEDELLKAAVSKSQPILWEVVAESVPGRTAIQCKERWVYRLSPDVKKTRFERWEDELIIRERKRVGNHWTLISNLLPGRTSQSVKNRWYSVLRNRVPVAEERAIY
ncbi:Myb-like DNA-binding domain containing protein [Histomonas meleagridis]|uniref:Myb-like DNA-binding domain containing protein n=1 Tax=Histomonas meleagridis TaxID=135588 RepID=UPI003559A091|nr:Myb-like DNA-binding domain containing protein [Histomonas meleagridis]KAH0803805.1 Myb-like DNA-binding domain containing protein [Histomonas meleagridis]